MRFEIEKGSFAYGERGIFKEISFSLEGGEILAVLGPNGCGKTTLLRCITGLLKLADGKVLLDGQSMTGDKTQWQKMAYVPQLHTLPPSYSVREMVTLGRSAHIGLFGTPSAHDREIVQRAVDEMGIDSLSDKRCDRLSGGELQTVMIARALAAEPSVLILDEPESGLDFRNQELMLSIIRRLSEKGMIVIFNTHFPQNALATAHKALLMSRDEAPVYGAVREVITADNIRHSFGVDVLITDIEHNGRIYSTVTAVK
ncbi:MAG: ABC transporter ATP-binding protein [Oscillospiraceae bacterium]|nr:ABC transporter ATP-binding protein [Oscillospiraceae bacterium]